MLHRILVHLHISAVWVRYAAKSYNKKKSNKAYLLTNNRIINNKFVGEFQEGGISL